MYEWFEPYKVVTDQSGVLLFCSNQTELVDYSSICWTKQNRTDHKKKHVKKPRAWTLDLKTMLC